MKRDVSPSRGVSLVEALLATALLALCLAVFLSVTVGGLRESTQTRGQLLADQMMQNTFEEILGERFGDTSGWWGDGTPAPGNPRTLPTTQKVVLEVNLEGIPQDTTFYRRVEKSPQQGGTGSFFGSPSSSAAATPHSDNYDVVKVSIFWTEATGPSGQGQDKSKVAYLTVWRGIGAR